MINAVVIICYFCLFQVLQSFKIMDYSLLGGVYNIDSAQREKVWSWSIVYMGGGGGSV